jgi:DnaJ family protein C protein 9
VLSDERRRRRYDNTGSTAETLDIDDDDFDWLSFFREQWIDVITPERIAEDKALYETNGEQRAALLEAYTKFKGDMSKIYQVVMHSDVLSDDSRFRTLIDGAIKDGEVEGFKTYTEESEKSKQNRIKTAKRRIAEWEAEQKKEAAVGKKGKKAADSEADLAALIRGKQAGRGSKFLEHLEEKYAAGGKGKSRKRDEEPPEEAFAATAARAKKLKTGK